MFRPPVFESFLSSLVGTGVQIIFMTYFVLLFSILGFLSPAHRGALLMAVLILFVFMSCFAGYYSGKFCKTFETEQWKANALLTAILYPGIVFAIFFVLN